MNDKEKEGRPGQDQDWPLGEILGGLSLTFYLATMARMVVPGTSARFLVQHTGLDPVRPMTHPVWGLLVDGFVRLFGAHVGLAANVLSAVCMAISVALIYGIGRNFVRDEQRESRCPGAGPLGGLATALFFAGSTAVWWAGTRAHPAALDVLLLLLPITMLNRFRQTRRPGLLVLFGLVAGIGMVENATSILWTPFYLIYLAALLYAGKAWSWKPFARAGIGMAAGLSLYLVFAFRYLHLPVAEWREFDHLGHALWFSLVEQKNLIAASFSRIGWMTIGLYSVVPWTLCLLFSRGPDGNRDSRIGSKILQLVLIFVALAVLFNMKFSPWRLTGSDPLFIVPSILIAIYFGRSVSSLYELCFPRKHLSSRVRLQRARFGLSGFAGLTLVVVMVAAVRNAPDVDAGPARLFHELAEVTEEELGSRIWLLSNGSLDDLLLLRNPVRSRPLRLLNARRQRDPVYLKFMASHFDQPELQGLALLGIGPVLSHWLLNDETIPDRLALQAGTDFWGSWRVSAVPARTIVLGVPEPEPDALRSALTENLAFWAAIEPRLRALADRKGPWQPRAKLFLASFSRMANNFGTLLEEMKLYPGAIEAYVMSRQLNEENMSALLNLYALGDPFETDLENRKLREDIEKVIASPRNRIGLGALVVRYGHIQQSDALEALLALLEVPKAELGGRALKEIRNIHEGGDSLEAMRLLKDFLDTHPDVKSAWMLLARIADGLEDKASLEACLSKMKALEQHWPELYELLGRRALRAGDEAEARGHLNVALQLQPDRIPLLELMVRLEGPGSNPNRISSVLSRLLTIDPSNAVGLVKLGLFHYHREEYALAEKAFEASLKEAENPVALNNLAWVQHRQFKNERALKNVGRALEIAPALVTAWDTLATIHLDLARLD
ncbi:MAG: glycosyltransferase family 39 protein, partial [Verrucomicrobiota bacterium]